MSLAEHETGPEDEAPADAVENVNWEELLAELKPREEEKRLRLDCITAKREELIQKMNGLRSRIIAQNDKAHSQERLLSSQAGQLLKILRREEQQASGLSQTVHNITKTRKQLLSRIAEPGWAVPHHYHMTALEHSLGHTQPHVMDVGAMIPGHLRLFSMANALTQFQRKANHALLKAKKEWSKVSDQIKDVYRDLRHVRAEIKDRDKVLEVLNTRLGNSRKKKKRSSIVDETTPVVSKPPAGKGGPRNIRMRYYQALNLKPQVSRGKGGEEEVNEMEMVEEEEKTEWAEVEALFELLEPLDREKQTAWEELELVLDERERIRQSMLEPKR